MSQTPYLPEPSYLHRALSTLGSAPDPDTLLKGLASTLYHINRQQPIALYRLHDAKALHLTYYLSPAGQQAAPHALRLITSLASLSTLGLDYRDIQGEFGIWGYVAYPTPDTHEQTQWLTLFIDLASQRLRLLKAANATERRIRLRRRRRSILKDMQHTCSIEHLVQRHGQSWCRIFQAVGIALYYQEELACFGQCPPERQLLAAITSLAAPLDDTEAIELDGECAGGIAVSVHVADAQPAWLMLFRRRHAVPLLPELSCPHTPVGYWLASEINSLAELADDLTSVITAIEIANLNQQLVATNQWLETLAHKDALTQCWNRYYTELVLDSIDPTHTTMALILFDIDDFKRINDTHGHAVGDDVLRDLVGVVERVLRQGDHLGRWGGEEFMILARELDHEGTLQFANRVRLAVANVRFAVAAPVSISMGATLLHAHESPRQWLERADQGLYLAKQAGKNRCVLCP
ncbi:sensor domain-containing diguanylate cyclase [Halomonas sp. 141]|uniref:GGDEF domain-containing protein n=1 Tax=unclassified Halomonas TaxID=2609666 RepID=UPI0009C018C3|nr:MULTISPECIES: GGDEF domain-containing protein [unclassified Halomonas]NGO88569.1 diguanylate cyclase [Halomonas sp.]PJX14171.1 sensor domain-containing diguanylate cyclase [Halomonas sp. 141]